MREIFEDSLILYEIAMFLPVRDRYNLAALSKAVFDSMKQMPHAIYLGLLPEEDFGWVQNRVQDVGKQLTLSVSRQTILNEARHAQMLKVRSVSLKFPTKDT
jgi:hypothetical protein